MSETPHVDAAIRAGCDAGGRDGSACQYRPCVTRGAAGELCRDHYRQSIGTLRAAFPWTPSAETIEAMQHASCKLASGCGCSIACAHRDPGGLDEMLAAYRAIPIVRELWPDLANAEPPGDDE